MDEFRMEMTITCATGDVDHFYNTVLMIAKGFEVGVIKSKLEPSSQKIDQQKHDLPQIDVKKKVFTIKEAANYLNISKQTLYKYTSEAKIPHYKIGNRTLFNVEELDNWLESRMVKRNG